MNIINMTKELFVKIPEEMTLISNNVAEKMKKDVLSAQEWEAVMSLLDEVLIPRFKSAGRFIELLDILNELHNRPFMQPTAADLYIRQGLVCESMIDAAAAIEYYDKGIVAYATMIEPDELRGYCLFNNDAFCHDYEKRFPKAQRLSEKAISIDRERHSAWKNRGVSLEHQDNYVEAAACYIASYIKCGGGGDRRQCGKS